MFLNALPADLHARIQRDVALAKYTAARLGGAADYLFVARDSVDEMTAVMAAAWANAFPARVLGGGANVLVSDTGFRGLVVINDTSEVHFDGNTVRAASGLSLSRLARMCATRELTGFEWAVSVPGTVGGAVVNNAGAHGGDMAGNLRSVELLDAEHGKHMLTLDELAYGYRTSTLKARADKRFLVLWATLAFAKDERAAIEAKMDEFIAHRKRTQPPGASLGSIFKNPPGDYAGRLIESCGLKGFSIGGAQVSPVHANFFINTGSATARDYYALIEHVRGAVSAQTGILLETEIEIIGDWS
jgi:UDP-N-acetylmuramate dehydrogenase